MWRLSSVKWVVGTVGVLCGRPPAGSSASPSYATRDSGTLLLQGGPTTVELKAEPVLFF